MMESKNVSTGNKNGFEITVYPTDIIENNIISEEKFNLFIESKLSSKFLEVFKNPELGKITQISGRMAGSKNTWDGHTIVVEY